MDPFVIIIAILGALIVLSIMIKPIRYGVEIVRNTVFAALGILITNIFMAGVGITLGINILTLGFVGMLGLPGFCAILLISVLL